MKTTEKALIGFAGLLVVGLVFALYQLVMAIKAVGELTPLNTPAIEAQQDKNANNRAAWATACINDGLRLDRKKEEEISNRSDCIDSAFRLYPASDKESK